MIKNIFCCIDVNRISLRCCYFLVHSSNISQDSYVGLFIIISPHRSATKGEKVHANFITSNQENKTDYKNGFKIKSAWSPWLCPHAVELHHNHYHCWNGVFHWCMKRFSSDRKKREREIWKWEKNIFDERKIIILSFSFQWIYNIYSYIKSSYGLTENPWISRIVPWIAERF